MPLHMDPAIIYQHSYADDSKYDGRKNNLDEGGFTANEADWYTNITGRGPQIPLFCDVSLACKAIVDGGMSNTIELSTCQNSTSKESDKSYLMEGCLSIY